MSHSYPMMSPGQIRDRLQMLIPPLPWDQPRWQDTGGPSVVLLHGLWRGLHAMEPLAKALRNNGFSTLNLPYPSTRLPISKIVEHLNDSIQNLPSDRPVHFITHSLGSIIARYAIAHSIWNAHRIVMLAPPSNGSEVVDFLQHKPILSQILGPAGRSLGTRGIPSTIPQIPPPIEAAAIMGNRDLIKCFNRLLETPNDGIVSASKGHIPELKTFMMVDADHTFISIHPETIRCSIEFLRHGSWSRDATSDCTIS